MKRSAGGCAGPTAGNEGVERQQQLLIGGRDPELGRIALDQRGGGDRLIQPIGHSRSEPSA